MGKKQAAAGWFAAVRRVFRPSSSSKDAAQGVKKEAGAGEEDAAMAGGQEQEVLLLEHFPASETSPDEATSEGGAVAGTGYDDDGDDKDDEASEIERARALAAAAEAAVAAAEAAARVVRMGALRRASREVRAAVRIQAVYRGYLARRALRALRGLVRLQALVRGHQVRRQVQLTMRCMQALVRAHTRRLADHLHDPLHLAPPAATKWSRRREGGHPPPHPTSCRHHLGLADDGDMNAAGRDTPPRQRSRSNGHGDRMKGSRSPLGDWDLSSRTLEADRAERARRREAAARRERALAYAYGYQQRQQEEEKTGHWLERWMAAPEPDKNRSAGAARDSYLMANNGAVPKAEASFRSPLNPSARAQGRQPGYMVATQSVRAKASTPTHVRSRSGGLGGDTPSAGEIGGQEPCSGYSTESSCTGDWTPPRLAVRGRANKLAYA